MWCFRVSGMLLVVLVVLGSSRTPLGRAAGGKTQTGARMQDVVPPAFELDPSWPRPSADGKAWPDLKRAATSVAVDSHDHVWALYVPGAAEQQAEAAGA